MADKVYGKSARPFELWNSDILCYMLDVFFQVK